MNRSALVFLAGVFLPSLILGWLALRTIGEQQIILEKRTAELFQIETDALAGAAKNLMQERADQFRQEVAGWLEGTPVNELAASLSNRTTQVSRSAVLFVIGTDGRLLAPNGAAPPRQEEARKFLAENRLFLSGEAETEVYQTQAVAKEQKQAPAAAAKPVRSDSAKSKMEYPDSLTQQSRSRNVVPQKLAESVASEVASAPPAAIVPEFSDFKNATLDGTDGILARFVNDNLQWIFWTRPAGAGGMTFGCMVPAAGVREWFSELQSPSARSELGLAILDERANPVFVSKAGFKANWRRPFVATEIGDVLPYWESAAYLLDGAMLDSAAMASRITIFSVIALALAAIVAAGFFVVRDARRQIELATKKTGFVSNVSHELKTPLTSIRMFAELLETGAGNDPEKRNKYLRIITLESERLTRLINNVLDFAKMDKKGKAYAKHLTDLHPVIERIWEGTVLHLEALGWKCQWQAADPPYDVYADPDAISQVIVNLISNAEKYGASAKSLELHTWKETGFLHIGILDRGPGVPEGEELKIFEAFYRANDLLSSGIPGSGLGLTLAQRIARDHDGRVDYARRTGGGSCFTLLLPLAEEDTL
jgi:signal transduction histidine kinase